MIGLDFPNISPNMVTIGFVSIKWYSMAYLVGIICAWYMVKNFVKKYGFNISSDEIGELAFYATIGVIVGGRLGYVVFYGGSPNPFFENPLQILQLWKGGMSFHGGIAGVIIAIYLFCRRFKFKFLQITDIVVPTVPLGIFLGRIANFINDELWGRVTDVSWAVKFPSGGYLPRHPSQLYEALLEGVLLFIILNILFRIKKIRDMTGFTSACFALGYALCRLFVEQFREPDAQLGFLFMHITMGQLLSVPLVIAGFYIIYRNLFSKPL